MNASSPIQPFLDQQGFFLLDGGLATELEQRGHDLNHSLWSAHILQSQPEAIREVHLSYLEAGANCLITASYQASFSGFAAHGISQDETIDLLHQSIDLACEARDQYLTQASDTTLPPLVVASIGPYGAYLANGAEYHGNYGVSKAELKAFHQPRWQVLAETKADLFACETIPNVQEAEVLLEILEETPDIFAWFSFACRDGQHISDGTPIRDCVKLLINQPQIVAVGVNCTAPEYIPSLIDEIRAVLPEKPIIVYPNSGEAFDAITKSWSGENDSAEFGEAAIIWRGHGATLIGGCCRTGPDHISAMNLSLSTS